MEVRMPDPQRIVVLGIGNPLKKDEGVGVRIVEEIMLRYEFPAHVDVVDAGTMGMSMLPLFAEYDVMFVADAVDGTDLDPGTVVLMTPAELAPNQVMHSLHDMRFPDVLAAADLVGYETEALIVGVQIEEISSDAEIGLTAAVEEALPTAIQAVLDLLAERGVQPTPRTHVSEQGELLRHLRLGGDGCSDAGPGAQR
jgi:hydrogenase maturation protease